MEDNSSNSETRRNLEDVLEDEPESKRGKQGQSTHDHERAGANSEAYGRTIAPQKGDLRDSDRAKGS